MLIECLCVFVFKIVCDLCDEICEKEIDNVSIGDRDSVMAVRSLNHLIMTINMYLQQH